jgi:AAA ATPase domain
MRLRSVYISQYKNLKDFTLSFDGNSFIDIFVGKNGTGKSNLFEALVNVVYGLVAYCHQPKDLLLLCIMLLPLRLNPLREDIPKLPVQFSRRRAMYGKIICVVYYARNQIDFSIWVIR